MQAKFLRRTILNGLMLASVVTAFGALSEMTNTAEASFFYRQRYSSWSYYPSSNYYYSSYYYKPYNTYSGYKYHYCVYYPSRPRYVYYYNPYRKVYWGRYDLEEQGYSHLAEKDQKEKLDDIPESAFPKPGAMPQIPDSEDNVQVERPSKDSLPQADVPKDVPSDK